MNKCSLKIFFELLLQPFDIPQSRVVGPEILSAIYNVSASWVIGKIVELWPKDQSYIDIIEPFLRSELIQVKNGYIEMPATYRNFLDVGALVSGDVTGICNECDEPDIESDEIKKRKYNQALNEGKCVRQAIVIVDQTQWDYLTKSDFDRPSLTQPVGCFFGEKKIRICPADIKTVEIRYLINENIVRYGYIPQPDDTYIFNPVASTESQFPNSAFSLMYKAASKLLGVYFRDSNIGSFSNALNDVEFK